MDPTTLVLAGPTCSGKTTIAQALSRSLHWPVVSAREAIETHILAGANGRELLQIVGARLESERPGVWLREAVDALVGVGEVAIVDAARTAPQVLALRARSPSGIVIQVSADRAIRAGRYDARAQAGDAHVPFEMVASSTLELEAECLGTFADVHVDTSRSTREQVFDYVVNQLEGFGRGFTAS
jgi:ATP-dependent protease Clp ATPase subunit